ncbi:MAG: divalent-cation tolerance protein CutA [bacterium]
MRCKIVFTTTSSETEAKKIARTLLEEKIAACAQIVPHISSVYWWKGNIDESSEVLIIIKTIQDNIQALIARIKQLHSYDVPEIVAVDIAEGNPSYLSWIKNSVACIKPAIKK